MHFVFFICLVFDLDFGDAYLGVLDIPPVPDVGIAIECCVHEMGFYYLWGCLIQGLPGLQDYRIEDSRGWGFLRFAKFCQGL